MNKNSLWTLANITNQTLMKDLSFTLYIVDWMVLETAYAIFTQKNEQWVRQVYYKMILAGKTEKGVKLGLSIKESLSHFTKFYLVLERKTVNSHSLIVLIQVFFWS